MLRYRGEKDNASQIIVNLWDNGKRHDDIMMDNQCPHINVVNHKCTSCGSFVGKWGYEKSILDFYKHSLFFVYCQKVDVHIISRYIIPPEVKISDFSLVENRAVRYRKVVMFPKKTMFLNSFLIKPEYQTYEYAKVDLEIYLNKIVTEGTVFLNPSKNDLGFNIVYKYVNPDIEKYISRMFLKKG